MEKDTKVVSITDKELLAICNLSNLKMEFANLENEELITENGVQKKILSNHTIYFINREINFIIQSIYFTEIISYPQIYLNKWLFTKE